VFYQILGHQSMKTLIPGVEKRILGGGDS
jgi:hypothetical protein